MGFITGDDLSANYEAINRAYNIDAMKPYKFQSQNSNAAGSFAGEQGGLNINWGRSPYPLYGLNYDKRTEVDDQNGHTFTYDDGYGNSGVVKTALDGKLISDEYSSVNRTHDTVRPDGAGGYTLEEELNGFLKFQQEVHAAGDSYFKYFNNTAAANNTKPYREADIATDSNGKVTNVTVFDATQTAASVAQIFGSALGRALVPGNNQLGQAAVGVLAGTVAGAFGARLAQAFSAPGGFAENGSLVFDASINDILSGENLVPAGAGAIASLLTAELGTQLHLTGFGEKMFDAALGGFTGSVLATITKPGGVGLAGFASGAIWTDALKNAGNAVSGALGRFLADEAYPADSHAAQIGGELAGALGSYVGLVVGNLIGGVLNFVVPGLGAFFGTVFGRIIADAFFDATLHPGAIHAVRSYGYDYSIELSGVVDDGDTGVSTKMANAVKDIVNAYLHDVNGAALAYSSQKMVGYFTNGTPYLYQEGWFPNVTDPSAHFSKAEDAVAAAAHDLLRSTEVIGGDLLVKRAHTAFVQTMHPDIDGHVAYAQSDFDALVAQNYLDLTALGSDLRIAQDYEQYLNNREVINAVMAATPNSAFTAGWVATFARVNDLGLNRVGPSDFLGGLGGWLDSVGKAGLGAEAANAVVKQSGSSIIVEVHVANGVDIPGSLAAFADQTNLSSDASGQTVQFVFAGNLAAGGFRPLDAAQTSGDAVNDLWFGSAGASNRFSASASASAILVGGAANDSITSGNGWDFLDGGAGNDSLASGGGNDILRGGKGNDALDGGLGDDTYVFARGDGADIVSDGGGADTLQFDLGISPSDLAVLTDGGNRIVGVKDPAHPGVPFAQLADRITLQNWADPLNHIEFLRFADGTVLNIGTSLSTYQVPFGESLSGSSVVERSAVGAKVGTVSGFDFNPDVALSYTLVNPDGRFAINASTGVLTVAGAIDYDAAHSFQVNVRISDGAHVFDQSFTINVIDIPNQAPTDIVLSGGTAPEDSPSGTVIATAQGIDPDPGTAFHYSLSNDADGRFVIDQTGRIAIVNQALIDYETASSYQVKVKAADQYGLSVEKEFTLHITDVYERVHADFNGDGRSDILWRGGNGAVALWNSGVPAGGHVVADPGPASNWHIAGLGDFDGNARADILWQSDDGTMAVWDNGTPGHVIAAAGTVDASWHIAGVGDFDGNTHDDILWRNDSGAVAVWNDGAPGHVIGDSPAGWHVAGVGDFDGNGKADILWQSDDGAVAVWDNGVPGHVIAASGTVDASWHIAGVGDFDGNRHDDILWHNDSGSVAVWNDGTPGHLVADQVATSWHIAGVGDFDGNGKADIFWRNDDGTVAIWDNGTPAGGHVVAAAGQVAANWHIVSGYALSAVDAVNRAPVLSVPAGNITANAGQPLQVSSLFGASDADGDALTYHFEDETAAANSGYFVLNGTQLGQGARFDVDAAQLAGLTFVAGAEGVADDLSMQLSDGYALSALGALHINVNHAPVLTVPANDISANAGQPLQVSSLFSASDADGDALTYYFQDGTLAANSGYFVLNGTPQAQGAGFSVNAAQLAGLTFVAGAVGFPDDWSMQLSDGRAVSAGEALHVSDLRAHAVVTDFNGDGRSDILWFRDDGTVSVWDNGDIAHAHWIADPGVVGSSWHIKGDGDFDGNHHDDILWQNDNAAVSVWDNGALAGAHIIAAAGAVAAGWQIAGVGDFDGNHQDDVLWRNDNGTVSIWDNGQLANAHVVAGAGAVPAGWHIDGIGDFDDNGRDDILWHNDDGRVSIWDNGQIAGAHLIVDPGVVASSWKVAGTGDFDGNGRLDILWRNDNGAVSIWDNGQIGGAHIVAAAGTVANSWHIEGVGDFDGNGRDDVLWRRDDATVSVWDNGELAHAHWIADPGQVANSWHIA